MISDITSYHNIYQLYYSTIYPCFPWGGNCSVSTGMKGHLPPFAGHWRGRCKSQLHHPKTRKAPPYFVDVHSFQACLYKGHQVHIYPSTLTINCPRSLLPSTRQVPLPAFLPWYFILAVGAHLSGVLETAVKQVKRLCERPGTTGSGQLGPCIMGCRMASTSGLTARLARAVSH